MNIPDTWPDLPTFVRWYKDNNFPIRVPDSVEIFPTDVSYSACIFRQDVYQVEIYLAKPNFNSTRHSHPFEQYIIYLGGDLAGKSGPPDTQEKELRTQEFPWKNLKYKKPSNTELSNPLSGLVPKIEYIKPLPSGYWHDLTAGPRGFIFLNLQKWPNKELMSSAVVEYNGPSLGEAHSSILSRKIL